jgi:hypothetical protein
MLTYNVKKNNRPRIKQFTISNGELDDKLLPFLVHATVCETFLLHTDTHNIGRFNKNELLQFCGRVKLQIRECGPPLETICGLEPDALAIEERQAKIGRLEILKNHLDPDIIQRLPVNVSPATFLETLLITVKNDVVSHQSFVRKKKIEKIDFIKKRLSVLKAEPFPDYGAIFAMESQLEKINDSAMRKEMERYRYFDILNNEKMTPRFLSLAKLEKNRFSQKD